MDEIEAAGRVPKLVHAHKAKLMMGMINKTDKLDARGLNRLQRTGTLPAVWIPPGALRDQREWPRTRMVLVHQRTRLKNRVHATVTKYGVGVPAVSDLAVTGHRLNLRMLWPVGLAGLGLALTLKNGLGLGMLPGWVPLWLAFDAFVKLHHERPGAAEPPGGAREA